MTDASPELFWTASLWIGLATLLATLLFLFLLFTLKITTRRKEQQSQAFETAWQPWLMRVALDDIGDTPHPPLHRGDAWRLIKLWIRFQMTLRGDACERLRMQGHALALDVQARQLVRSKRRSEQIFGILTLGHMHDRQAWDLLSPLLAQPSNTVAAYAGWALLKIDVEKAAPKVLAQLQARTDIDIQRISSLFKPFRSNFHPLLATQLQQATTITVAKDVAWLLKISLAMGLQIEASALNPLLANGQHMDVVIGAMRLLKNADGLPAVRALTSHPDWQVRTQAAITLGRLGEAEDIDRLTGLLMDPQWWVRYRAAQALAQLPFFPRDQVAALIAALPDRYAQDIAKQVFAEIEGEAS